jgi:hypothetical protein
MIRPPHIIVAWGDDGQQYTIYIYRGALPSDTRIVAPEPMDGTTELATSDGQPVRWRAKGVYEVITTGVVLRSAAQDAP